MVSDHQYIDNQKVCLDHSQERKLSMSQEYETVFKTALLEMLQ